MSAKIFSALIPVAALGLMVGCSHSPAPKPSSDQAAPHSAAGGGNSDSSSLAEGTDLAANPVPVSAQDALDTAKKHTDDAAPYSIELEFERRHNAWIYQVELLSGSTDHEVQVNASSGAVIHAETERSDDREQEIDLNNPLPYTEALDLAKKQADGRLASWTYEFDDGSPLYSFEFGDGPSEREVKVDAQSKRAYLDD